MRISDWSSDVCSSDLPDGDAPAGDGAGDRQDGVARLRERRMVVVAGDHPGLGDVADVEHPEAGVPDRGPHLVADAQGMVQAVLVALPGRPLAGGDVLARHGPARTPPRVGGGLSTE